MSVTFTIVSKVPWPITYLNPVQGPGTSAGSTTALSVPIPALGQWSGTLTPAQAAANASIAAQTQVVMSGMPGTVGTYTFTTPCVTAPPNSTVCLLPWPLYDSNGSTADFPTTWGNGFPQCGDCASPFVMTVATTTSPTTGLTTLTNTISALPITLINGTGLFGLSASNGTSTYGGVAAGGTMPYAYWGNPCPLIYAPTNAAVPASGMLWATATVNPLTVLASSSAYASCNSFDMSAVTLRSVSTGTPTGAAQLVWTGALSQPGLPALKTNAPAALPPAVSSTALCPLGVRGPVLTLYLATFVAVQSPVCQLGTPAFVAASLPFTNPPSATTKAPQPSSAPWQLLTSGLYTSAFELSVAGVTTPPLCSITPGQTLVLVSPSGTLVSVVPFVSTAANLFVVYVLVRATATVRIQYLPDFPVPPAPLLVFAPGRANSPISMTAGQVQTLPPAQLSSVLALQMPTSLAAAGANQVPVATQYGADGVPGAPSVTAAATIQSWITAPAGSLLPQFSQNVVVCPGAWLTAAPGTALTPMLPSSTSISASEPDVTLLVLTPWVTSTIQQYVRDVCSLDGWSPCADMFRVVVGTPASCMGAFVSGPLAGPCTAACSTALQDIDRDLNAAAACDTMINARCNRPGADDDPACACVRFQTSNVHTAVFGDARTYDNVLQLFMARFGIADTTSLLRAASCWWPACLPGGALRQAPSTECPANITQCVAAISGTVTDSSDVQIKIANLCNSQTNGTREGLAELALGDGRFLAPGAAPVVQRSPLLLPPVRTTSAVLLGVAAGVLLIGIIAIAVILGLHSRTRSRHSPPQQRTSRAGASRRQ